MLECVFLSSYVIMYEGEYMNKQNVLMVHNFYQIGGGEHTVFQNEVELLKKKGHKVITYTRDNMELNKCIFKKILLPFTTIWSFKTYREVKRIIKNEQIDIVHCHNTFPLISSSVYYAARKLKVPVVQTIHNFRFLCPCALFYRDGKICEECLEKNSFKSAIKHKCYRKSRLQTIVVSNMLRIHRMLGTYKKINYIFLTKFNRNKFDKLIGKDYPYAFIKPNFVEHEFSFKRQSDLNNTFVFMGRLDENKGIRFLLDAWKEIKDYELHIYGDGVRKKEVLDAVKNNSNIKYFGFQQQKVIFEDLVNSQGLVIPSELYEGFPMTIAESFGLKVPVISSDVGNHASIVNTSKGGITYKLYDKQSFIDSINEIVKNNKEYGNNAYKYYCDELLPDKNYEELINIYEKASVIK